MSILDELKLDLGECKTLLTNASRPNVRHFLASEITKIESRIKAEESKSYVTKSTEEKKESGAVKEEKTNVYTTKLTSYGWDQTKSFVKIYITLKDVETLPTESVKTVFTKSSFDVTIAGLHGKNFNLAIKGLLHDIVPSDSTHKAKSGTLILSLKKEASNSWEFLTALEKKAKDIRTPKVDKDTDPQESIMTMMKQMYEDGDDDMKRTIAKAWSESRDKQATGFDGGLGI